MFPSHISSVCNKVVASPHRGLNSEVTRDEQYGYVDLSLESQLEKCLSDGPLHLFYVRNTFTYYFT